MVLWRPASRGRQRQARIMDARLAGHAVSPGPVGRGYPFANGRVAQHPLTRSALAFVFRHKGPSRGRADQEA